MLKSEENREQVKGVPVAKGTGIERRQYFGGTFHTKLIQALLFPAQILCGDLETRGSHES